MINDMSALIQVQSNRGIQGHKYMHTIVEEIGIGSSAQGGHARAEGDDAYA